jgi:polar amino acid transport system substrate-binding protein
MINRRGLLKQALLSLAAGAVALRARSAAALGQGSTVLVGLPNNVFANLDDGRPTGLMAESVQLILTQMGYKPAYISMPGGEMAAALQDGTIGLNTVAVKPSHDNSYALYSGPIVTEYNVVAIRAAQNLAVDHLSDLHGLVLGGRVGYDYPLLENDPQITLKRFSQDGELIRNLILGRIDAAIISAVSDIFKLRAEGVMPRLSVLSQSVGTVPLRAALSRKIFAQADLDEFNIRLIALKASPEWTTILERNGMADLAVEWPTMER